MNPSGYFYLPPYYLTIYFLLLEREIVPFVGEMPLTIFPSEVFLEKKL